MRNVFQVSLVVSREDDGVVFGSRVGAIEPEIHHECGAGPIFAANGIRLVSPELIGLEQSGDCVAEICVDDYVIALDLLTADKLHSNYLAAFGDHPPHRLRGMNVGPAFTGSLGHSVTDATKPALHMIDTVSVLSVRDHGEQAWTIPRRHTEILGLEREGEPQFLGAEIGGEHLVERPPGRNMRKRSQERGTEETQRTSVGFLQARVEFAKAYALARQKAVERRPFSGKDALDFGPHSGRVRVHVH